MEAGVVEYTLAQQMPASLADRSPRAGDEELAILLFRRSTMDLVLRRTVAAEPGVTLHPGMRVTGLAATDSAIPRVTGLHTDHGTVAADLVIDASGRRSRLDQWLDAIGARRSEVAAAECGVAYYTRYYRLRPGATLPGSPAMLTTLPLRRFMVAHFGCDNETMGLCLVPLAEDRPFKVVRNPATFTAVLRTVAPVAAWLDVLDPLTDVYAMGDLHNTLRRTVVGGEPVAHGLLTVGDSLCTTNPTFARGIGFAMQTAVHVVDAVAAHPLDELAKVMDEVTSTRIAPWFADQAAIDSARLAAVRSVVSGTGPPAATGAGSPGAHGERVDLPGSTRTCSGHRRGCSACCSPPTRSWETPESSGRSARSLRP
jgi:2-polyprenyl-6-methoxyphenol hydroxylase-like FAD-dependent oxidoreductase